MHICHAYSSSNKVNPSAVNFGVLTCTSSHGVVKKDQKSSKKWEENHLSHIRFATYGVRFIDSPSYEEMHAL